MLFLDLMVDVAVCEKVTVNSVIVRILFAKRL